MNAKRVANIMGKLLQHELRWLAGFSYDDIRKFPLYLDRQRGPFLVAFWHEKISNGRHKLVVQVCKRGCLGMSVVIAGGFLCTHEGFRELKECELWDYC